MKPERDSEPEPTGPRDGEDPNKYTWGAGDIVMLDKNGDPMPRTGTPPAEG